MLTSHVKFQDRLHFYIQCQYRIENIDESKEN